MRLLFVIEHLATGGAQRQMVALAQGLLHRGHDIEFFTYYPQHDHFAEELRQAGILIHAHRKTGRLSLRLCRELRRRMTSGAYDGVLAFLSMPGIYSELARCCRSRPVLVVSERGPLAPGTPRLVKQLLWRMHAMADALTVNSHHQREDIETHFPRLRGRIVTIYNGVDPRMFYPGDKANAQTPSSTVALLGVGTVRIHKNLENLIRALALYRQAKGSLPVIVRWAGRRSLSEDRERAFEQVERLLTELDLHSHWEWLGERRDVADLLRGHDALIHPSLREGLSNAMCEALACGRPVLAHRGFDHERLVEDGRRGFLFDGDEPADIAVKLRLFCELSAAQREEMAFNAHTFAAAHLSLSAMVDGYERLFVRMLGG